MTICIAAITTQKETEHVVFSTDHMVSTAIGQFEHSIIKYKQINKNTVAMLAGNPLIFEELIRIGESTKTYKDIQKSIFENFRRKRSEIIQREIFNIYGIDGDFIIDALKGPINNAYVGKILQTLSEFKLETSILLAGFEEGKARISEIDESNIVDYRDLNFHTIGSGNIQAANTLLFQKHDKKDTLLPTLYTVYKAKRNAEVLEGVGKETELLILSESGCIRITPEQMEILKIIYEKELKFGRNHADLKKISIKGESGCL